MKESERMFPLTLKKVKQAVDFDRQILVLQVIKAQTSLRLTRQNRIFNFNQSVYHVLYSFRDRYILLYRLSKPWGKFITNKAWHLVCANIWVYLVE